MLALQKKRCVIHGSSPNQQKSHSKSDVRIQTGNTTLQSVQRRGPKQRMDQLELRNSCHIETIKVCYKKIEQQQDRIEHSRQQISCIKWENTPGLAELKFSWIQVEDQE